MSDQLKPLFFIVRDNGIITPLIATDELPHHIRLEGVPRNLSVEETEGMTNIGRFPGRHQQYKVININDKTKYTPSLPSTSSDDRHDRFQDSEMSAAPLSLDHALSNISTQTYTTSRTEYSPSTPLDMDNGFRKSQKVYGVREQRPEANEPAKTIIANPDPDLALVRRASKPSTRDDNTEVFRKPEPLPSWKDKTILGSRLPPPGKKVYCSHWMSTGECDFAQQGCMFRHEMPLDLELLNFLGYQDIPKWYRERHGIGRLTAVPGSGAHLAGATAGASTKRPEAILPPSWNPAGGKNPKQTPSAFGRRPANGRFAQIANSPFRSTSTKASPKTGGGAGGGSRQNNSPQDAVFRGSSKPHGRIRDPAERKSIGTQSSSLLDSRFAPMRPSNNTTTLAPGDHLPIVNADGQSNSSDSSSYYPSNESNTTAMGSPRTTVIAQAYPTPSNTAPHQSLRQYPANQHLRRGSTISHISAFSDAETDAMRTNITRRTSEEERYARLCAQAKRSVEEKV